MKKGLPWILLSYITSVSIQHWWIFCIIFLSLNYLLLMIPLFYVRVCWAVFQTFSGCSQLNRPWQSLGCSVAPDSSHFPVMLSWFSIDRVSTRFFVSPMYSSHNHNLIHKHWGNCFVIATFLLLHSIFFSLAADVKITLHPIFQSYLLILGCIIGIDGSLTMLLSAFSVLGAWCLFSLIMEYK